MTIPPEIFTLEKVLGYSFSDRTLLAQALRHPSLRQHQSEADDNQRLEFLGDAVLGLVAAEYGYHRRQTHDEGRLTLLRSATTSSTALASVARAIGLGPLLVLGRSEEIGNGRDKDGNLADALEAVIGAMYLDGGLNPVRQFYERAFTPDDEEALLPDGSGNPKGCLQEWTQARGLARPAYHLVSVTGPSHAGVFTVEVQAASLTATGTGNNRRSAEVAAATHLLKQLA